MKAVRDTRFEAAVRASINAIYYGAANVNRPFRLSEIVSHLITHYGPLQILLPQARQLDPALAKFLLRGIESRVRQLLKTSIPTSEGRMRLAFAANDGYGGYKWYPWHVVTIPVLEQMIANHERGIAADKATVTGLRRVLADMKAVGAVRLTDLVDADYLSQVFSPAPAVA